MNQSNPTGQLIVFEGIDGAGKSTQVRLLADRLQTLGFDVLATREPTESSYGRRLRESAATGRLSPTEELELFVLDRKHHVQSELAPALDAGRVVLVDRYFLSTAAYQGARGLDPEQIMQSNEAFAPSPTVAFLLETAVEGGRDRIRQRGDGDGNLFERSDQLRKVAAVFQQLDRPYIVRIDGTRSIEQVHDDITAKLSELPAFAGLAADHP